MLVAIAVFVAIFGIVAAPYWFLVLRPEEQEERALKRRLRVPRVRAVGGVVKGREKLSSLPALDAILSRSASIVDPFDRLIDQSGLSVNVGTILLASAFCAVVVFAIADFFLP